MLDHDFGHLCRGRRIQISGRFDFGICNNFEVSSIFDLGSSGYCVRCLSCASWQSWYDIQYFCSRHLWCWWSLFSKYCIWYWIIFHKSRSTTRSLYFCQNFSLLIHSCFCLTDFHYFGHKNKLVHKFVMNQRVTSFSCNVVIIIRQGSFQTLSCGFVGFHDACKFLTCDCQYSNRSPCADFSWSYKAQLLLSEFPAF